MSAPMLPPAPGRLSITTGWPHDSVSFLPISRPNVSATPPTGNGTTMRIGLSGYVEACADAKVVIGSIAAQSSSANALRMNGFVIVIYLLASHQSNELAVSPESRVGRQHSKRFRNRLGDEQTVEWVGVERRQRGNACSVRRAHGHLDETAFVDGCDQHIRISVDLAEPRLDGDLPNGSGGHEHGLCRLDRLARFH